MCRRVSSAYRIGLVAILSLSAAAQVSAQNVTVQLPTFHVTGVSTTVVVPDRGSLYLGGVNRSSLGSRQFGPGVPGLGNRAGGRAMMGSGFSINATIIDHDEIDRALLAEAARRRGATVDVRGRPVADAPKVSPAVTRHWNAGRDRDRSTRHVAPLARQPEQRPEQRVVAADTSQAEMYLARARRAEAQGRAQQAKIFYQRVVKHGDQSLKKQAEAKLAQLEQRNKG